MTDTGTGELIKRLRQAKANGDPSKYIAGVTVADAHAAADALEAAERERELDRQQIDQLKHHNRALMNGVEAEGKPNWAGRDKLQSAHAALKAAERVIAPFAEMATTLEHDVDGAPIYNDTQIHVGRGKVRLMPLGSFRAARDWLAAHATGQRQAIHLDIPPMPEGAPATWKHRDPATLYWLPVVLKGPCAVTQWYVETPCGKTTIIDAEDHAELVPVSTGQRQGGDDAGTN